MTLLVEPHPGLLSKPSDVAAPVREAGGDNEVLRDKDGRPRIMVDCWLCDGTGKVTSDKTGNPIKCQGCGPKKSKPETHNLKPGKRLKSYTRVTTYIDVLDDKSNIEAWQMRMVLVGVDRDRRLLDGASDLLVEQLAADAAGDADGVKAAKNELNRRAQIAKKTAGAEEKADKGTFLHGLSELVDMHEPLPPGIDFGDVIDMDAYRKATHPLLKIVHMEKLVVNDEIGTAGTPDRVSECLPGATLVAPDGHVFEPGELIITDLKGFALDTPIPTPTGWTTMAAVQVGDKVIGADGKPCTVTAKSGIKWLNCYRVTFDDTTSLVCDEEHLWETTTRYPKPQTEVRSVLEIRDTLVNSTTHQRQHSVKIAEPLALDEADLPIDPYVLGVWLGDGRANGGAFTKGREDGAVIAAEIGRRGYTVSRWKDNPNRPTVSDWNPLGLERQLRLAGLRGNKHVPDVYLRGSERQRLDLLRGLMDADGTYNRPRKQVVFSVTDKALAESVRELAISLGERALLSQHEAHGFGLTVTAYAVKWTPLRHNPFLLPRKADQVTVRRSGRNHRRLIVSIEQAPTVPTACIAVDSSDRMYLVGDAMVPTHNTGTTEYGGLKMAQQLAVYAHSHLYDKETGERIPLGNINQQWGIIMSVPAGQGECNLLWADLRLGWEAVLLAGQVRKIRSLGRKALIPFGTNTDGIECK